MYRKIILIIVMIFITLFVGSKSLLILHQDTNNSCTYLPSLPVLIIEGSEYDNSLNVDKLLSKNLWNLKERKDDTYLLVMGNSKLEVYQENNKIQMITFDPLKLKQYSLFGFENLLSRKDILKYLNNSCTKNMKKLLTYNKEKDIYILEKEDVIVTMHINISNQISKIKIVWK